MANWVYFSADGKKEEVKFATVDEDKKIIVAPVLIPDLKILRIDEQTGETYNVYLSKETIEKLAQNYLINGFQQKATLEHDANIDGEVSVVESWVSKSQTKDKSALYFNRTFPIGTWFVTFKVLSDTLWNDYIKTGKVKAVSIEGLLSHKLVQASSHIDLSKEITELTEIEADIVLSQISALFETPSIPNSSYPGQSADSGSGYIAPALFAECFPATQDVELNLKNRQNAIDKAMYGPLDIKNPGDYWDKIAERWKVDVETAKGEICGNCAFFDVKQQTLDCIAEGIGDSEAENILELGSLGYCHAFSFKCNANRSCLAHVDGGPIKD
jgi:hypothetical protein